MMKKPHLRLLSVLLAAALLIGCVPARASALGLLDWLFSDDEEVKKPTGAGLRMRHAPCGYIQHSSVFGIFVW